MRVVAGDIGGTKTLLAVVEVVGHQFTILQEQRFDSAEFNDFSSILTAFLKQYHLKSQDFHALCLALAGPVHAIPGGWFSQITNLPWTLNSTHIAAQTGFSQVIFINDFAGVGYGILTLSEQDRVCLQSGTFQPNAPLAVIGAGTGLGHAILVPLDHGDYRIVSSEAGHIGFAPENEEQLSLWRYLAQRYPRVTPEHLVSGAGLVRIFEYYQSCDPKSVTSALRHDLSQGTDLPAIISRFGLSEQDPCATRTVRQFCALYGSMAANLALTCLAHGGVYIAGGIAPKILPALQHGEFLDSFLNKAPMSHLLHTMPVWVVNNEKVGLLGAAWRAAKAC